jgi:hypothetical protein
MEKQSSIVIRKITNKNDGSTIRENSLRNFVVYTKPPLRPDKRNDDLNQAFCGDTSQPDKRARIQVVYLFKRIILN